LKTILYTKFFKQEINEPVNVILSPEFYWIKKIDIPIKSLKDAKKIAKTLFKLDEKKYIFDAFKLENKFFAVAFEKNLNLNIPKKYINSIRIAQTEFYNFDCIKIDEKHSIQKIEDLLFCFPFSNNKECTDINEVLKKIKLSNIKFNLINKLNIDKSIIITFSLIFILVNLAFLIKTYAIKKEITLLENKKEEILNKNNLPKTSFELNSILQNLKEEYKKQVKIKKDIEYITKTPLKQGEYFTKFSYNSKNFYIEVKTSQNLDNYFKKHFKVESEFKNNFYKASLR